MRGLGIGANLLILLFKIESTCTISFNLSGNMHYKSVFMLFFFGLQSYTFLQCVKLLPHFGKMPILFMVLQFLQMFSGWILMSPNQRIFTVNLQCKVLKHNDKTQKGGGTPKLKGIPQTALHNRDKAIKQKNTVLTSN